MNPNDYTLITGASGGIGLELARVFASRGHHLILVARSTEKLNALKAELEKQYSIRAEVITKDLSRPDAARELFSETQAKNLNVSILINNAGFGIYGPFSETDLSKELEMLRLNILSLTELTKFFLAPMKQINSGKILNVASTAAFQPGPLMAAYYASKAYVLSFSEALDDELRNTGVSVSTLCPGPTDSDFQSRAAISQDISLFKASRVMSPDRVARAAYGGLMKRKRVILPGITNKITPLGMRFLPRKVVTAIVRALQESRKNTH